MKLLFYFEIISSVSGTGSILLRTRIFRDIIHGKYLFRIVFLHKKLFD